MVSATHKTKIPMQCFLNIIMVIIIIIVIGFSRFNVGIVLPSLISLTPPFIRLASFSDLISSCPFVIVRDWRAGWLELQRLL